MISSTAVENACSSNDVLMEVIDVLRKGLELILGELHKLSNVELRPYHAEIESILAFLGTLTSLEDTMSKERFTEAIRNALKSLRLVYKRIPPSFRQRFSAVAVDPKSGMPEFLSQAILLLGPALIISENQMKAWMLVNSEDAICLSPDTVVVNLKQNGIIRGIDEKRIREIFTSSLFDREICIAEGTEPTPGEDTRIEYLVHLHDLGRTPALLAGGKVSFKDIRLFSYVKSGDVLARLIPPTRGTPGYTVTDQVLTPSEPEETEIQPFENSYISEDGMRLIAATDGCISKRYGQVIFEPMLQVSSDVSFETGNINSKVVVLINRNVLTGFSVQSEGDIHVQRIVEGARLESKGTIVLEGGIQGKGKAMIEANGDVIAKFICNAKVSSLGNVISEAGILNSRIWAGGKVANGSAEIVGGEINADAAVVSNVIGSEAGVKTVIRLGVRAEELARLIVETEQQIAEQQEVVDNCSLILGQQNGESSVPPGGELDRQFARAEELRERAQLNINDLLVQADSLQVQYEESLKRSRSVRVRKNIMPGTVINIQGAELSILEPTGPVTIVKQGGNLVILPFKELDTEELDDDG